MKTKMFSVLITVALLLAGCASTAPVEPTNADPQPETTKVLPTGPAVEITSTLPASTSYKYPVVDTAQGKCYDNNQEIECASSGEAFYGQDAQYSGAQPSYTDNGDGTVTDNVTGLMWQQDPGEKMTYDEAVAGASSFNLAGYTDWRLPTIKELYSLILFDGTDVSACNGSCSATPFIDTRYFNFSYGDTNSGERVIDSQFATSTRYVSTTMNGNETMFGVNFADGRIKGYGTGAMPGQSSGKLFYVLYVRGNPDYGQNAFVDNGDGTIRDQATGLTWMKTDSGEGMDWEAALSYCENLEYAGGSDWVLPNAKQLQSIVDYSRSPDTSGSAAIDPIFDTSSFTNEAGQTDYPFYWSSTTHADSSGHGTFAAYVSFGRALGYMNSWVDVHGAGAQRSDPKTGSAADFPEGHGPQGDAVRVNNYVRCVRGGETTATPQGNPDSNRPTMTITSSGLQSQNGHSPAAGQQPAGQTPPAEALAACAASSEGAACSFTVPNGTVNGTCRQIQQQLACVPSNQNVNP